MNSSLEGAKEKAQIPCGLSITKEQAEEEDSKWKGENRKIWRKSENAMATEAKARSGVAPHSQD